VHISRLRQSCFIPETWKRDRFYAPHGVAYGGSGNLLTFNPWGGVTRVTWKIGVDHGRE